MNWSISKRIAKGKTPRFGKNDLVIEHAHDENESASPDKSITTATKSAAAAIAKAIGGEVLVEVGGHESLGKGFQPAHVTLSVSRVDPAAAEEQSQ